MTKMIINTNAFERIPKGSVVVVSRRFENFNEMLEVEYMSARFGILRMMVRPDELKKYSLVRHVISSFLKFFRNYGLRQK